MLCRSHLIRSGAEAPPDSDMRHSASLAIDRVSIATSTSFGFLFGARRQ
jgi:hypothetical protein